MYQNAFSTYLEEARDQDLGLAASFRAHPIPASHGMPYVPHRSTKPLTDAWEAPMHLSTEERMEKRRAYDEQLRQKEALIEQERALQEEIKEVRCLWQCSNVAGRLTQRARARL